MSLMFIEDVIIFSGHTSIWLFYVYFKNFIFTKIKSPESSIRGTYFFMGLRSSEKMVLLKKKISKNFEC